MAKKKPSDLIVDQTPDELGIGQLGLKFKAPDADAPGYFALRKQVYKHAGAVFYAGSPMEEINAAIEFLARFVTEPEDRDAARDLLETKVSRSQYLAMMGALIRSEGEEIFPFGQGNSSGTGSEETATTPPTKPLSSSNPPDLE